LQHDLLREYLRLINKSIDMTMFGTLRVQDR